MASDLGQLPVDLGLVKFWTWALAYACAAFATLQAEQDLQRRVPLAQLTRNRELDLERRAIDNWDGHLPATLGPTPFLGCAIDPHRD